METKRKLAAIMFSDIVGYTVLMGNDEQRALKLLDLNRSLHQKIIRKHKGKLLKEMGDGILATFTTITDAVYCAAAIQKATEDHPLLKLRIGIHQGEVVFQGNDVFGDGVNIASRIQAIAPSGGIWISESVTRNIQNKKGISTAFISEEVLKNVKDPLRIYELKVESGEAVPDPARSLNLNRRRVLLAVIGIIAILTFGYLYGPYFGVKPKTSLEKSIAVLPFEDMSPSKDQEYFADGMMLEILNHLIKIEDLRVIPRTSVLRYKGSTKTITEIAKELKVSSILTGSVRKAGEQFRISVSLNNGKTNETLWNEDYNELLKDLFTMQSQIAQAVANKHKAYISVDVQKRINKVPTENIVAYDLFLQARFYIDRAMPIGQARSLLDSSIMLDPKFAQAYAYLGYYWMQRGINIGDLEPDQVLEHALPVLNKAIELDNQLAFAHNTLSFLHLWFRWDFESSEKERQIAKALDPFIEFQNLQVLKATGRIKEALELSKESVKNNPESYLSWYNLAECYIYNGQGEEAVQVFEKVNDILWSTEMKKAHRTKILTFAGKYEEAIKVFESSPESLSQLIPENIVYLAIAYYHTDQFTKTDQILEELKKKAARTAAGSPSFCIGLIYAQMQEIDLAFKWLERAYVGHEVEMYWLKMEPHFAPLQSDPRWKEMLKKVGFPD